MLQGRRPIDTNSRPPWRTIHSLNLVMWLAAGEPSEVQQGWQALLQGGPFWGRGGTSSISAIYFSRDPALARMNYLIRWVPRHVWRQICVANVHRIPPFGTPNALPAAGAPG